MGIKGDVRSIPLANVLQDLAMNEQTGTLRIRNKDRQLSLWFDRGALRLVGIAPREGPSLLNGLLALDKITPDEPPAFTGRRTTAGGFVRGLVKKGRVSRDDLRAALQHQMGEHLCDAFLWPDATFEFEEGEPDDRSFDIDQLDLEPKLAVDGLIMEAVRRADEWGETRKAILSQNEILVPDADRFPTDADATMHRVFKLLDGERSLREIEDLTRLGHFTLLRAAALLMRKGAARTLSSAEAFERARLRTSKKDWPAALKMAKYGLDHERKNTGLLEIALRASEELENAGDAAAYARQLASAQAESNQLEAAIRSYQKVLANAPKDLTAQERLFEIMLQLDLKLDALAQGEALAAAYKKAGLPDKAATVYAHLMEKLGDQPDLLESLAEIQRHLGDKHEAVKLYRKLLNRALEAKNDQAALDYCRTILRMDPRHDEALKLRQELESGQVERTRQRKRTVRNTVVVAVLAALVGGGGVYEYRARRLYQQVWPHIHDAAGNKLYDEELRQYDRVLDQYRWSLKAREIRPERNRIEKKYADERLKGAAGLEEGGQLLEAEGVLQEALQVLRRRELRESVIKKRDEIHDLREAEEKRWTERLEPMPPEEIARQMDRLAIPALRKLLKEDKNPQRRAAAVAALGAIKGKAAAESLLDALADPAIAADAATHLLNMRSSPFRAALWAPAKSFTHGESIELEWRVTNISPAHVEFTLVEAPFRHLQVSRLKEQGLGTPIPLSIEAPEPARRTVRLGPGEFVGGTFPDLVGALSGTGSYRARWSVSLEWSGKPVRIIAYPLPIERR